jgi:hypothetical protein
MGARKVLEGDLYSTPHRFASGRELTEAVAEPFAGHHAVPHAPTQDEPGGAFLRPGGPLENVLAGFGSSP